MALVVLAGTVAGGGLMLAIPQLLHSGQPAPAPDAGVVSASAMSLTGLWAANGEECSVAKHKIKFDGAKMWSVSSLGTLYIGEYTLSGTNPMTLLFADGEKVVFDASHADKLAPMTITPDNKPADMDMMHLTRC